MGFKPRSVRELLKEALDKAVVQFDLSMASLLVNDQFLAKKVIELEQEVDNLINDLYIHVALSVRSPKDAEDLVVYFHLGSAINALSDTAANLAEIVTLNMNPFLKRKAIFEHLHDHVEAIVITKGSKLLGSTERALHLKEEFGVDIMAIRRDKTILIQQNLYIKEGDVVYLRGPRQAIDVILEYNQGELKDLQAAREELKEALEDEDEVPILQEYEKQLVNLINVTNLMIDIALVSQLDNSSSFRDAIVYFENTIDKTMFAFYEELLETTINGKIKKKHAFALYKMANEMEILADAIFTLMQGEKHRKWRRIRMLESILESSAENIEILAINEGSPFIGKSVWDVEVETKVSGEVFDIVALKRQGKLYPYPKENLKLQVGDVIIVKTYQEQQDAN